jgi:pyruvate,water dikinase
MVTMEPATTKQVCSWDSTPNPHYNLYTTGNVEEIVPGVIRPLIADLFRRMDHGGIKELHERIGVSDLVHVFEPPVANFLPIFAGRMALNLAWANAIISTWQTSDEGSALMDQFISAGEGELSSGALADRERAAAVQKRVYSSFWPQCAAAIDRNNDKVSAAKAKLAATDLAKLTNDALWQRLDSILALQCHLFANHLGVSGAAGEYASITAKLLARELGDGFEEAMVPALTTGLGEVESARPGFELWKLGRLVASRPALAAAFANTTAAEAQALLASPRDEDWKALARHLRSFLDEFGFRGQQEADPSVGDWAENPTFVLSVIRANAQAPADRDPMLHSKAAQKARQTLEMELANRVSRKARREFMRVTGLAQHYARNRERTKACWVRSMRLSRPLLQELAARAARSGAVAEPDDFYFLTWNEAQQLTTGQGLAATVAARRREAADLELVLPPAMFEAPPEIARIEPGFAASAALAGVGVSAGSATGPARVVRSAAAATEVDLQPGEILIAPFTDAAWTPLFIPAAGVVVETGGLLSHAAIVAREFGIPAVVAVKGATSVIQDGQTVTIDGAAGTVTLG